MVFKSHFKTRTAVPVKGKISLFSYFLSEKDLAKPLKSVHFNFQHQAFSRTFWLAEKLGNILHFCSERMARIEDCIQLISQKKDDKILLKECEKYSMISLHKRVHSVPLCILLYNMTWHFGGTVRFKIPTT